MELKLKCWNSEVNAWEECAFPLFKGMNPLNIIGFQDKDYNERLIKDGNKVVLSIGIPDSSSNDIFQEDIVSLHVKDVKENDLFWNSSAGKIMKDKGFEEILLLIKSTPILEIKYDICFKTKGQFISENEYYEVDKPEENFSEKEFEDGKRIFFETDTGSRFVRYLVGKGAKVIGNTIEEPNFFS